MRLALVASDAHVMAGREQYPAGHWRDACEQLASELGWKPRVLRDWFAQLVGVRVSHSIARLSRDVHEDAAFRDLVAAFDKRAATYPD